jgi:AraC family transcriptional regulator, arabinose operon regulatory protein
MSFSDRRLTFPDPHTDIGRDLECSMPLPPEIRIHEAGFMDGSTPWRYQDVLSPFWRLYRNRRAGARIECGGASLPMHAGELMLIPELTRFSTDGDFRTGHLWIHFSLLPSPQVARRVMPIPGSAASRELSERLADGLGGSASRSPSLAHHAAMALVHLVLGEVRMTAQPVPLLFQKVIRALHDDPGHNWDNHALAKMSAMSTGHFIREFKRVIGVAPRHYLTGLRVRHAARMLTLTWRSLEEIADASGFANRHYFTRVFTRELGVPPAAYRRSARAS